MPRPRSHRANDRTGALLRAGRAWAGRSWTPRQRDDGTGTATYAMNRLVAWCAGGMHAGIAIAGGAAALLAITPPATAEWVVPAVLANCLWAAVFAWIAVTRGLVTWAVVADVAVTVVLCLSQPRLVDPAALTAGVGWVSMIVSMAIVAAQLAWRVPAATAAGLLMVGAYLAGARLAGAPDGGVSQAALYLVQIVSAAAIMVLVRRASRAADAALREYHETERRAGLERARRAEDREHNRRLHDTVLATLTIIGSGGVRRDSLVLRQRAAGDLGVILGFVAPGGRRSPPPRLDLALRRAVERLGPVLTVDVIAPECEVPAAVADAFSGAVTQALHNVVRHAGVSHALVRLADTGTGVTVEISDAGRGFDPARVPGYRYGLRESIVGRMRAVGGTAQVTSAPGGGTRVRLGWSPPAPVTLAARRAGGM